MNCRNPEQRNFSVNQKYCFCRQSFWNTTNIFQYFQYHVAWLDCPNIWQHPTLECLGYVLSLSSNSRLFAHLRIAKVQFTCNLQVKLFSALVVSPTIFLQIFINSRKIQKLSEKSYSLKINAAVPWSNTGDIMKRTEVLMFLCQCIPLASPPQFYGARFTWNCSLYCLNCDSIRAIINNFFYVKLLLSLSVVRFIFSNYVDIPTCPAGKNFRGNWGSYHISPSLPDCTLILSFNSLDFHSPHRFQCINHHSLIRIGPTLKFSCQIALVVSWNNINFNWFQFGNRSFITGKDFTQMYTIRCNKAYRPKAFRFGWVLILEY